LTVVACLPAERLFLLYLVSLAHGWRGMFERLFAAMGGRLVE